MDAQSNSCPSFYRQRDVVAREVDLFKTISPFELGKRAIIFCAINEFAVNETARVLAFANLHRMRQESIHRSFITVLVLRQDLNQHSNSVHVDDFDKSNECVAIKRPDKLAALEITFVLYLHSRKIFAVMPKLLPLADRCFVIDFLNSAYEPSVERDRSNADALSCSPPDVFARFLGQFLPPILEA